VNDAVELPSVHEVGSFLAIEKIDVRARRHEGALTQASSDASAEESSASGYPDPAV
jgi:hypothetical protein